MASKTRPIESKIETKVASKSGETSKFTSTKPSAARSASPTALLTQSLPAASPPPPPTPTSLPQARRTTTTTNSSTKQVANPATKDEETWCSRLISALSLVPRGATPIRWSVIGNVVVALFTCVVNITMLFPYLPQMIRDMSYKEQEIGFYAGTVASSYFIGAFFSSNLWGFLTDRWGRRPVMLICLSGTGVCTLAFGFSGDIYWAFFSRFLVGVFNGIIGATKAVLGDISDNTNQALGLALLSAGWGSGLLLGPSIGGYLSEPVKKYPNIFPENGIFATYPYLLPNLLSSALCFITLCVCFINLPETRFYRACGDEDDVFVNNEVSTTEKRSTRPGDSLVGKTIATPPSPYVDDLEEGKEERRPLLTRPVVIESHSFCNRIWHIFGDSRVVMATMLFSIFGFACVALDETIALWAATKQHFGGLGFNTNQLGTMTGALNIPCLLINVFIFPRLERHLGSVRTYCLGTVVLIVTTVAIPFINKLCHDSVVLWIVLVLVLAPNRMMYPICWSAADILINNSVYPENLGLVNGLAMTFSFFARSASPLAAGSIFSWSISTGMEEFGFPMTHHLVFFVIDISMIICLVIGVLTPRSLDKQPEKLTASSRAPRSVGVSDPAAVRTVSTLPASPHLPTYASYEDAMRQRRLFRSTLSSSLTYSGPPPLARIPRTKDATRIS